MFSWFFYIQKIQHTNNEEIKKGEKEMRAILKSKKEILKKLFRGDSQENDLRYVEARAKAGHGNISRLLRISKDRLIIMPSAK